MYSRQGVAYYPVQIGSNVRHFYNKTGIVPCIFMCSCSTTVEVFLLIICISSHTIGSATLNSFTEKLPRGYALKCPNEVNLFRFYSFVQEISKIAQPKPAVFQKRSNSCYRTYKQFGIQTRRKGQFDIVLTLSPRLHAF